MKKLKDGIQTQCIGDHESIAEKQVEVSATAYYYLNAKIMSMLANILNKWEDEKQYAELSSYIGRKFKEKFLDSNGKVGSGTQANQSLFLAFGIGSPEEKRKAEKILIDDVEKNSRGLTTGIFGTKYLMRMLSEAGVPELALSIVMSKKFPGWGYMLENGATTLWEHWEFSDNVFSHNHPMFGSVSEWFYKDLGGISPEESAYGFDKIIIKPEISLPLGSVKCEYESARGKIISSWTKEEEKVKWQLKIPPNTDGKVILQKVKNVELEGISVGKHPQIREYRRASDNRIEFSIPNGSFDFTIYLK